MAYQPIENYGVIGDMHTAALVGMNGSIDWCCFPHFDSPSIFAAILDDEKGGRFKISPIGDHGVGSSEDGIRHKQLYLPETNVLVTRFLCPDGVGEVTDFMPTGNSSDAPSSHLLVRRVQVVRGSMGFEMLCQPAFNFARDEHRIEMHERGGCFRSPQLDLELVSDLALSERNGAITASFELSEGASVFFVLRQLAPGEAGGPPITAQEVEHLQLQTVDYWHHWISQCTYRGRWREMVTRSALALKLLTFEPTGAIVAAPTCSLPEDFSGVRNWDYRYTWIRDASFTLYALLRIGFHEEATRFMGWLDRIIHHHDPQSPLQIMYGIDGQRDISEEILGHLEGYRGSRPVRVGNAAFNQFQLDIYGELMDSVYLYNKHASPISYDLWRYLRKMINWLCDNWHRADHGIWETRGGKKQFVYSKVMCWVALDRALRTAQARSFPADYDRWLKTRDQIYEEVMTRGWNERRRAFVQHYQSESLDASNLIMPLVFFLAPNDPRALGMLEAISRSPSEGGLLSDSLVYRYNWKEFSDGVHGDEGTFNMCTFWLVEAMTRAGWTNKKRLGEARLIFEKMLGYANHLGLYSEETGSRGEAMGNFPQAFTHLALISAAFNLDRALGARD